MNTDIIRRILREQIEIPFVLFILFSMITGMWTAMIIRLLWGL